MFNLSERIIKEIHDPTTGRVDGVLFAGYLGLSVSEMAQILKCSAKRLRNNKTFLKPVHYKENLMNLYIIIGIAKNKHGNDFRIWLNAPNHQLDNKTPIEYLRFGGEFSKLMIVTQEEHKRIDFEWLEFLYEDELKAFIVELVYATNYQESDLVHEWRETAISYGRSQSENIFAIEDDGDE